MINQLQLNLPCVMTLERDRTMFLKLQPSLYRFCLGFLKWVRRVFYFWFTCLIFITVSRGHDTTDVLGFRLFLSCATAILCMQSPHLIRYLKQVIKFFKAAIRLRQMVELVECKFHCMLWYRLPLIRNDTC